VTHSCSPDGATLTATECWIRGGPRKFVRGHNSGERVEREPIMRVWGQSPQRGTGAELLVGVRGEAPEAESFLALELTPQPSKNLAENPASHIFFG